MFTYIITYRHGDEIRQKNLHALVRYLRAGFPDAQIIVTEQDAAPRLTRDVLRDEKAKYVFLYNPREFNRGWGFNCGLAYARYDVIVMGNHDFVVPHESLLDAMARIGIADAVSPFTNVIELRAEHTKFFLENRTFAESDDLVQHAASMSEGIVIMTREALLSIGGWDESVIAGGSEDDLMSFKTQSLIKFDFLPGIGYHLHDGEVDVLSPTYTTETETMHIETMKQMSLQDLSQHCQALADGNGNPLKYKRKRW